MSKQTGLSCCPIFFPVPSKQNASNLKFTKISLKSILLHEQNDIEHEKRISLRQNRGIKDSQSNMQTTYKIRNSNLKQRNGGQESKYRTEKKFGKISDFHVSKNDHQQSRATYDNQFRLPLYSTVFTQKCASELKSGKQSNTPKYSNGFYASAQVERKERVSELGTVTPTARGRKHAKEKVIKSLIFL